MVPTFDATREVYRTWSCCDRFLVIPIFAPAFESCNNKILL